MVRSHSRTTSNFSRRSAVVHMPIYMLFTSSFKTTLSSSKQQISTKVDAPKRQLTCSIHVSRNWRQQRLKQQSTEHLWNGDGTANLYQDRVRRQWLPFKTYSCVFSCNQTENEEREKAAKRFKKEFKFWMWCRFSAPLESAPLKWNHQLLYFRNGALLNRKTGSLPFCLSSKWNSWLLQWKASSGSFFLSFFVGEWPCD